MKKFISGLLFFMTLLSATAQQKQYAQGNLIIEAKPNQKISVETFRNVLLQNDIEEVRYLGFTNYYLLKVKKESDLDGLIKKLSSIGVNAFKDEIHPFDAQGTITTNDAANDMGYWNSLNTDVYPGKNCMDSVLAFLPPLYKNSVDDSVEKVTFIHTEIPRLTHFDMPFIDSFRSVDMLRGGISIDTANTTPHGSWTAGCGFAKWENASSALGFDGGMTGMTNNNRPVIINIADAVGSYSSAIISMLYWCYNYCQAYPDRRLVISFSFAGSNMPQPIAAQMEVQNQILLMHSAGNANTAAFDYVDAFQLNIMATGPNGQKASFSNYGQYVDIAFQGAGMKGLSPVNDKIIDSWQGTSASAPCAAGFLVTLWNLMPQKTASEMKVILKDRLNTTSFVPQPDGSLSVPNLRLWYLMGNIIFPLVKTFQLPVSAKLTPVVNLNGLVNDLISTQVSRKFYVKKWNQWEEIGGGIVSIKDLSSGKRLFKYRWINSQTTGRDGENTFSEVIRSIEVFNTKPLFDSAVSYCSSQSSFKIKLQNCPDVNSLDSLIIFQGIVNITNTFNRSDSTFTITPGGAVAVNIKVKYFKKDNPDIADSTEITIQSTNVIQTLSNNITGKIAKSCEGPVGVFTASTNSVYNTYQWKKNGIATGSNEITYTDSSLTNGDQIVCDILPLNGCWNTVALSSNNITVSIPACQDNFSNATVGIPNALTYQQNSCDSEAVLSRNSTTNVLLNSFVKYDSVLMPRQGTIEMLLLVTGGSTSTAVSTTSATVFAIQNRSFNWLGSGCMLTVYNNGNIIFRQFNNNNGFTDLTATATPFRFNEKHIVGISFGSEGMKIAVDGIIRASNSIALNMNKGLGIVGGVIDPVFSGTAWYQFTGIVDKFRMSYQQSDFQLSNTCTSYLFTGNGNWSVLSNWRNNMAPPSPLPNGYEIIIDGDASGESVLDRPQVISNGARMLIKQGKKIKIPAGFIIQ